MPPHASTSSAQGGTNKAKNKPVQTHNANHTLRAGARKKAAQIQRADQSQQRSAADSSGAGAASGSSLRLDQLDVGAPLQSKDGGTSASVSAGAASSSAKGKQREGQAPKNAAANAKAGAGAQPQRKQVFKQVLGSPLTVNW